MIPLHIMLKDDFPHLGVEGYIVTSPKTRNYNCIAWAAEENELWWWPERYGYWPKGVERKVSIEAFIKAYETKGYKECKSSSLETGYQKICLYLSDDDKPTHAARQLSNGNWTSKLGRLFDIEHNTIKAINGPAYGTGKIFMKRKIL